jgi:hypothetical protein
MNLIKKVKHIILLKITKYQKNKYVTLLMKMVHVNFILKVRLSLKHYINQRKQPILEVQLLLFLIDQEVHLIIHKHKVAENQDEESVQKNPNERVEKLAENK